MNYFKYLVIAFLIMSFNNAFAQQNWDKADEIVKHLNQVTFPDKEYFVTDFGAVGDLKTPCKEAFEKAITKCSENGGGTIVVKAGDYYMNGPLVFKSNVNIQLNEKAILHFSTDENDYLPAVLTRWEGTELYNYSPFIYAYHVNNIALTGKGTVNGNGAKKFAKWKDLQTKDQELLRKMGRENVPVYKRVFGKDCKLRPGFFEAFGCSNVRVEGVTFKDSPFWVMHPIFCNNVIVRGVTVNSYNYNNDGCDPESCSNVLIENCIFSTGDDAIAIKSGRDNDAWRVGRPTEDVVIRNCTFQSKINGVCIGSEMSGGVRNVFIENIVIPKSSNAIYFKSNLDRGGYIENIFVRNIQADSVRTTVIRFEPNYKGEHSSFNPTRFNSFVIENVSCKQSGECGIYMSGLDAYPLKNLTFSNIKIGNTPVPYCLKNAENVSFEKVIINGIMLNKTPVDIPIVKLKTL
jgi:polygalacturonase